MSRAGRPRLAVIATAVVFILTTIVAAVMSRQRTGRAEVSFSEPKPYRALSVRASFPTGWEIDGPKRVSFGYIMAASPPEGHPHGQLFVFKLQPRMLGRLAKRVAIQTAIQSIDPDAQFTDPKLQGSGSVGALESELYGVALHSPALGEGLRVALANVALTPDRQILGVLLVVEGQPSARDRRLLREFSDHIAYERAAGAPKPTDEDEGPIDDADDADDAVETSPRPRVQFDSTVRRPTA